MALPGYYSWMGELTIVLLSNTSNGHMDKDAKSLQNVISDLGDIFKEKLQRLIILRGQRLECTGRIKCVWHPSKHKS